MKTSHQLLAILILATMLAPSNVDAEPADIPESNPTKGYLVFDVEIVEGTKQRTGAGTRFFGQFPLNTFGKVPKEKISCTL